MVSASAMRALSLAFQSSPSTIEERSIETSKLPLELEAGNQLVGEGLFGARIGDEYFELRRLCYPRIGHAALPSLIPPLTASTLTGRREREQARSGVVTKPG